MGQSTCSASECDKPARNAGMCWGHYCRQRRHGIERFRTARIGVCARCGSEFDRSGKTGPMPRFCGDECSRADRLRVGLPCDGCGAPLKGDSVRARKYCTDTCRSLVSRHGKARPRTADCASCGKVIDLTRRKADGSLWYRSNTRRCDPCSVSIRPNRYPLTAREVADRDGTTCRWCYQEVDFDQPVGSKWRASVDHIIPWSRGGPNTAENLQLLHRVCNAEKGVRMPA